MTPGAYLAVDMGGDCPTAARFRREEKLGAQQVYLLTEVDGEPFATGSAKAEECREIDEEEFVALLEGPKAWADYLRETWLRVQLDQVNRRIDEICDAPGFGQGDGPPPELEKLFGIRADVMDELGEGD